MTETRGAGPFLPLPQRPGDCMAHPRRPAETLEWERRERELRAADQTLADLDQTHADADQQGSEDDQRLSSLDQELSDRDQHASDRDQMAADWEREHASSSLGAEQAHRMSRVDRSIGTSERTRASLARARIAAQRSDTAARRDEAARMRDRTSEQRDRTAQARDDDADARDHAAAERERRERDGGSPTEALRELRTLREESAALRHQSALDRLRAAADREAAAADRRHAAHERRLAGTDELTGVLRRGTGETALDHEIERARRSGRDLAVAIIDVDDLKTTNDTHGHAAGDTLLRAVAAAITAALRPYDLIIRWGGDEFVFAMPETTAQAARQRIDTIRDALAERSAPASISTGHAQLRRGDTLESLVARADAALYDSKRSRGG